MADGNIIAAKKRLEHAVERLTHPRPGEFQHHMVYAPSLYNALLSDIAGTQGDTRTPAKSLPPLWLDAVQLIADIDKQVLAWCSLPGSTPQRLQSLREKPWRPQDTDHVNMIARQVFVWCDTIVSLLDPQTQKYIETAACPSCGQKLVHRRDSAGEVVRQPALKIVMGVGCTCQACGAFWAPDKFLFLGRLLGYDLPEGVLE